MPFKLKHRHSLMRRSQHILNCGSYIAFRYALWIRRAAKNFLKHTLSVFKLKKSNALAYRLNTLGVKPQSNFRNSFTLTISFQSSSSKPCGWHKVRSPFLSIASGTSDRSSKSPNNGMYRFGHCKLAIEDIGTQDKTLYPFEYKHQFFGSSLYNWNGSYS